MKILLSMLFVVCGFWSQAQIIKKKSTLSANYAISSSIFRTDLQGSASIDGLAHSVGLHYNRYFSMDLFFETGIRYSSHSLNVSGTRPGGESFKHNGSSSYLHVPLLIEYNVLKYLFAQLGPTVSITLKDNLKNDQSGIGIWGAFGVKFPIKNYELKVYPYYHTQSLISFSADNSNKSLQNIGANIGFGYRF